MSRTQNAEGKQGGWPAAGLGVRVGAPWGNHAGYDAYGRLTSSKDPRGNSTTYAYNVFGQIVESTNALNYKTRFEYDPTGNLVAVTDPLGNRSQMRYDAVSRLVEAQDAQGRRSGITYDRLDRIVTRTDAKGNTTQFTYDGVGNLLSLTDARGKGTTFTYDPMNRLLTRTDPLLKTDYRVYDLNGNLTKFTDRRGQVSNFTYDFLDRLVEERYQDGAVVTRSYDANGRLQTVTDSESGVFTFAYDAIGQLLKTTGPNGTVNYQRDALGQVARREVVGGLPVTYVYDASGNLSSASMTGASVTWTFDNLNRPETLSRLNGVNTQYSYDAAGRLLNITHARGATVLSSSSYSVDAVGNRTALQSNAPQGLVTQAALSTVNDANQLIQRGTSSFVFDANGNLVSETNAAGTTTYTWDGRNRLRNIASSTGQSTTLGYDFAINLIRQLDAGPSLNRMRSFVLDDLTNVALYEQDGSNQNVLTGKAIDDHLALAGSNVEYRLSDGLNSTVATTDAAGTIVRQLSYEPFGQASQTAGQGEFPFQFTGRVPVWPGNYYYRARFYNTVAGRFISEDPIDITGGIHLYQYAENNVIGYSDPLGLTGRCIIWRWDHVTSTPICIVHGGDEPGLLQPEPTPIGLQQPPAEVLSPSQLPERARRIRRPPPSPREEFWRRLRERLEQLNRDNPDRFRNSSCPPGPGIRG